MLHTGHILHLQDAKSLGDVLIVTITDKKKIYKGPGRPYFDNLERAQSLAALSFVDFVAISEEETALTSINTVKPNYYCKGQDYSEDKNDITGKIIIEKKALKKINAKLHITNQNQKSSSKLLNEKSDIFTDKSKKFLNSLRKRFDEKKLIKLFKLFNKKKILILGETIIDEYVFCEALGKSGKDPILVMREIKVEKFLGGVASIAKCLSSYSDNITLVSTIGEKKEYLNFIKKNLPKTVKHFF